MQVEAYLEAFADRFDLHQYIRYETRVLTVRPIQAAAAAEPAAWHGNGPSHWHIVGKGAVHSHDASDPPRWQITTAPADAEVCFCSTLKPGRHRTPVNAIVVHAIAVAADHMIVISA